MKGEGSENKIPDFARSALWSYDIDKLDLVEHRDLIIKNILDYGSKEATDWLMEKYSDVEIQELIKNTPESAWGSKKSLNYWSLLFAIEPKYKSRAEYVNV